MELHRRHLDGEDVSGIDVTALVDTHVHIPYATGRILDNIKETTKNVAKSYLSHDAN